MSLQTHFHPGKGLFSVVTTCESPYTELPAAPALICAYRFVTRQPHPRGRSNEAWKSAHTRESPCPAAGGQRDNLRQGEGCICVQRVQVIHHWLAPLRLSRPGTAGTGAYVPSPGWRSEKETPLPVSRPTKEPTTLSTRHLGSPPWALWHPDWNRNTEPWASGSSGRTEGQIKSVYFWNNSERVLS